MKTINILIIGLFFFSLNQVKGQNIKVGDFIEFTLPADSKIISHEEAKLGTKEINNTIVPNGVDYIFYTTKNLLVIVQPIYKSQKSITDKYIQNIKALFEDFPEYLKTLKIINQDKNSILFFDNKNINIIVNNKENKGFAMQIRYKKEDKLNALNEKERFLKSLKFN